MNCYKITYHEKPPVYVFGESFGEAEAVCESQLVQYRINAIELMGAAMLPELDYSEAES